MPTMKPIAQSMGVKLHCPIDGRYAFFNSPYIAHENMTGLDIYTGNGFGVRAPSPVNGKVILIRKLNAPKGNGFKATDHDTIILIENEDNSDTVTKLLHLDPLVQLGTEVHVGDPIGVTLRSGYYGWGTSPHFHVEIRSKSDPIRARGGYQLDLIDFSTSEPLDEIAGTVIHLQPEFAFIQLESKSSGLVGTVNEEPALLDGGIPYYRWHGAHLTNAPDSGVIELQGIPIADIKKQFKNSCTATCLDYQFIINNKPLLGLSLTMVPNYEPYIKLIPLKRRGLKYEIGDWVEVKIQSI
jgi:murein DD-endopeptidase MepM/ murein hydrolase activator NlpD